MPRTANGTRFEVGTVTATVTSGAATVTITFTETFARAPQLLLGEHLSDSPTYGTPAVTSTGATIAVSGSNLPDGSVIFDYVALERT